MSHLSLSLLGPFHAKIDDEPAKGFESNKVRALLAYLAVEADRLHRREALAELLWPGRCGRNALANLRYALYDLRKSIGDHEADPPFLLITRRTLQFNTDSDYTLDVESFGGLIGEHSLSAVDGAASRRVCPERSRWVSGAVIPDLQSAVSLYRGPFLEGFSLGDCPAFEEWALFKREYLNRKMVSALQRLAVYAEQAGRYEQARHYLRRELELEPWQEEAHRRLMRLLALGDQRSAALAQYETCRRLLAKELDVELAQETTALYERIRDGKLGDKETGKHGGAELPILISTSPPPHLPPFVGRERELSQLEGFLEATLAGQGRVVFVTGDVGSGKTALINEFIQRAMERRSDVVAVSGSCNARIGIGDPYSPFREIVQLLTGDIEAKRAGGAITRQHALRLWNVLPDAVQALVEFGPNLIDLFVPGEALALRAEAFAPREAEWRVRLDELVQRSTSESVDLQRVDLFEQFTRLLRTLARRHPLILVLDDLQWAGAGSISLLFHLGRRLANSRILVIGAYRPDEVIRDPGLERHPLEAVIHEFQREFGDNEIDLNQADGRRFVDAFLDSEPNRLDGAFRETLYRHTGGNPLFTVELLRGMQERGDLVHDEAGRWVKGPLLDWEKLPARVEAAITERLGRLSPQCRRMLRAASVEGEEFTAEVVARVQGFDEGEVTRLLSGTLSKRHRLVVAQSLRRKDGQRLSRYRFRHYLFQKYLYNHLDAVERAHLHEAVGNTLEQLCDGPAVVLHLAHHFEAAGMIDKAADYVLRAGKRAVQMSAHQEAIVHYTRGIELLRTLPESPERARKELTLQIALGAPLQALKSYGSPERGRAYARARELSQQLGDVRETFQTLLFQWSFDMPQAEHRKALDLAEQLLILARQMDDPAQTAVAHMTRGISLLYLGEFTQAQAHLERALTGYDPQRHHPLAIPIGQDLKVTCKAYLCWVCWLLGYPGQALRLTSETLSLARQLEHPFSLGFALGIAGCVIHLLCGKYDLALADAEKLLQLWEEQGFPLYRAWGLCVKGRVLTERGRMEEGLASLREGVTACKEMGIMASHTQQLANFIEACRNAGEIKEGLSVAEEALRLVEESGERHFEAELYLRKGELLMEDGSHVAAEDCLRQAIEIARLQRAKSWELRAAMILYRLWRRQGREDEAQKLLSDVYREFSAEVDVLDLRKARALLNGRSAQSGMRNQRGDGR